MSAPLVVNTRDGACWTRRTVTEGGIALYALAGSCKCPEFVMATESELAALGIAGSADVLPVPVGPMPQGLSAEREREIRSLDLLALMSDRVAPVVSGHLAVLLDEIDRLREERHTTNEALSDAAEALRADRCPCPPASRPHQVGCPLDGVPASSERPVNGLTAKFMPVPSLREVLDGEHYASVHHDYSKGRDVPGMDGTR